MCRVFHSVFLYKTHRRRFLRDKVLNLSILIEYNGFPAISRLMDAQIIKHYFKCFSTQWNAYIRIVFKIRKLCNFNWLCLKLYKSHCSIENIFYIYKLWKILMIFELKVCFRCDWNQIIWTNQKSLFLSQTHYKN